MTNPDHISEIERVVMRRVRIMRVLRIVFSNGAIATGVCLLALWGIGREVWVARVFQNAPANAADALRFYLYAFDHTRLLVQALTLAAVAGLVMLARETARLIVREIRIPARAQ
jgi:hypothetical protein